MCVAQRERSASAARAQRELSATAPARKAGGVGVLSCARHSDARCRCGARSTALMHLLPARSARRCVRDFRAIYPRWPRAAAAAGVPVRVRVRCSLSLRGASAMRRERRPIAVPTPPCPHVPSHPQPARGRSPAARRADNKDHPRRCVSAAGGPPRATEIAAAEQARLVRSFPPRELRGIAPKGREGRSAITSQQMNPHNPVCSSTP